MQTFVNIRLNENQGKKFVEGLRSKGFNVMPNDNTSYIMMKGKARLLLKEDRITDDLLIEQFIDEDCNGELAQILVAVAKKFGGELIIKDSYGNEVHIKDKVDQIELAKQQVEQEENQTAAPVQPSPGVQTSKVGQTIPTDIGSWMNEVATAITNSDQPRLDELLRRVPMNASKIALNTLEAAATSAGLQWNMPMNTQAPQKPASNDPEMYKNMAINAMSKLMEGLSTDKLDTREAFIQVTRIAGAIGIWDEIVNGSADQNKITALTEDTKNTIELIKKSGAPAGLNLNSLTGEDTDESEIVSNLINSNGGRDIQENLKTKLMNAIMNK